MSLLLEARKKAHSAEAQHAASAEGTRAKNSPASAADAAKQNARDAGQNLFGAKSPVGASASTHPYFLYALGGTVLLLGAGAGYWWHLDSAAGLAPPAATQAIQDAAVAEEPKHAEIPVEYPVAEEITPEPATPETATPTASSEPVPHFEPQARASAPVRIEAQRANSVDPLLRDAYLAYRDGKQDRARTLYQAVIKKEADNHDALLGLAAIAQQRGEGLLAAQYYARVLALDPRDAVANAGMSALTAEDGGNESRLKTLLREQGDSATLHFALGNLYAGQSRWSEAQQSYFDAWTLDADNAEFAYNLAVSLDHLGQTDLAARYYRRAQQLDAARRAGFDHAQVARRLEQLDRRGR